jgi:DNA-directed RNA polymerase specialized sigma subunit
VLHIYEWLKDYRKLEDEIAYPESNLERSESELKRWTSGDLLSIKLTDDSIDAKLEESIKQIKVELAHKRRDLENLVSLIGTFRGLENNILYKKYIEGKTLVSIADEIGTSPNYIYNKHAKIMRMMEYAHEVKLT